MSISRRGSTLSFEDVENTGHVEDVSLALKQRKHNYKCAGQPST